MAGQRRNHARNPRAERRRAREAHSRARKDGRVQRDGGTNGQGAGASDRGD